jgi:chromosome segregation ATPase
LEAEIEKLKKQKAGLRGANEVLVKGKRSLRYEVKNGKVLKVDQKKKNRALHKQIDALRREKDAEITRLKDQIKTLQLDNKETKLENASVKDENKKGGEQFDKVEEKNSELQHQVNELTTGAKKHSDSITTLTNRIEDLEKHTRSLEQGNTTLQKKVDTLATEKANIEKKNTALQQVIDGLNAKRSVNITKLQAEVTALKHKIADSKRNIIASHQQPDFWTRRTSALEKGSYKLNMRLQSMVAFLQNVLTQTHSQLQCANDEVAYCKNLLADFGGIEDRYETLNDSYEALNEAHQGGVEQLKAAKKGTDTRGILFKQARTTIVELNASLSASKAEVATLGEEKSTLENELAAARQDMLEWQAVRNEVSPAGDDDLDAASIE